jgi:hypothetical protein
MDWLSEDLRVQNLGANSYMACFPGVPQLLPSTRSLRAMFSSPLVDLILLDPSPSFSTTGLWYWGCIGITETHVDRQRE